MKESSIKSKARFEKRLKLMSPEERADYKKHRAQLSRTWRKNNPERVKAWARKHIMQDYERYLWHAAKARAKERGVEFSIQIEDIPPRGTHCPLLGHPFSEPHSGPEFAPFAPSLDRINPNLGYIKGNVWIVGRRANLLKNDGTAEEHEMIARAMRAVEATR